MPFAAPSMSEEEELKNQQTNGGVNISGESGSFATGVPGQEADSSAGKPKSNSGAKFANIQNYLSANQQQGDKMGTQMAGGITAAADEATQKVTDFSQKAPTITAYDPSAAYENVTSLSDSDKTAYNAAKQGYKGPQTVDQVDGYADTQKAAATAATKVQNVSSEQGQRELLKETYKRPSYSAGENALDQTLVQNSPNSKAAFEGINQKYAGISSLFDTAATDVGAKVNAASQQGLANQKAVYDGEAKALPGLLDPIKARADEQTRKNAERIASINGDISDDVLSEDTLAALGISDGQQLWDMNLSNYLTPDQTQVGVNNAATAEERSKYAALTALINGTAGSDITADGKEINPIKFDNDRFAIDTQKRGAEFQNVYENQKGTMGNPFAGTGISFGGADPGQMSAKEIEQFLIPQIKASGIYQSGAAPKLNANVAQLEAQLASMRSSFGAGRAVKKG